MLMPGLPGLKFLTKCSPQRVASAEAPSERTLPFKVNFWPGVKERERREREQSPPGPSGSVAEQ